MSISAAVVPIPGTGQAYVIALPQTASDNALPEHDTIKLLQATVADLRRELALWWPSASTG